MAFAAPTGVPPRNFRPRVTILLGATALLALVSVLLPRIPQDQNYHAFADTRSFAGIPNAADVLTNLPLLLIGAGALLRIRRRPRPFRGQVEVPGASLATIVLAAGILLTGFGSGWYHWRPTDASLFWDRLPMTVVMAGGIGLVVADRIGRSAGLVTTLGTVFVGVASLVLWRVTAASGHDDLRAYGFVQVGGALLVALMVPLFPTGRGGLRELGCAATTYGLAKLTETFDRAIFDAVGGAFGGHALKHLLAAGTTLGLLRYAEARRYPAIAAQRKASREFVPETELKRDLFGAIVRGATLTPDGTRIPTSRRDLSRSARLLLPVTRELARREVRALARADGVPGVPALVAHDRDTVHRAWIDGRPLATVPELPLAYFAAARRLLRALRERGVTHNDTHKEANWLVRDDGSPALVDFQLAGCHLRRSGWFRLCGLEDLRHLLKHQRARQPASIRKAARQLLRRRSWVAAAWMRTVKPLYRFVTRRILHWRDREGRG